MKRRSVIRATLVMLGVAVLGTVLWISWAENHPGDERALRMAMREKLEAWFPDGMRPPSGEYGWTRHQVKEAARLTVILVHGLDEPGDIWQDLIPALGDEPVDIWELRYPNDQAVDRSSAFLAEVWPQVPADRPAVLIGHSMGGLVIRDFVGAWRHPVGAAPRVEGAAVRSVFLVGTPNHGSEWARLRVWLELRDHFLNAEEREFSLFASLRDGVGTAKVDLRPGSRFLETLNARPWPEDVELRLIAGDVLDDGVFRENLEELAARAPTEQSAHTLREWWSDVAQSLGDGVVTVESVRIEGMEDPIVLPASHRGLLRRSPFEPGNPPAIPLLRRWIREVLADEAGVRSDAPQAG